MNGFGFLALIMAGTTFPLAFGIARLCLEGVIRVLQRPPGR